MTKLNLGSHNKRMKGYTNVDALPLENVDVVHNLTDYPYPFEDNSIDEILMTEVLEHISWRDTVNVLRECKRILKGKETPTPHPMVRMANLKIR